MLEKKLVGKRLVVIIGIITIGMDLAVILLSVSTSGKGVQINQVIRFILTVLLFCFMYRQRNWARWTAAVLFEIAAVLSLLGLMSAIRQSNNVKESLIGISLLATTSILYLSSGSLLIISGNIQAFFHGKQETEDIQESKTTLV